MTKEATNLSVERYFAEAERCHIDAHQIATGGDGSGDLLRMSELMIEPDKWFDLAWSEYPVEDPRYPESFLRPRRSRES